MTPAQEEILYQTVFFTWPEGHRHFDMLMSRLREMVVAETQASMLEVKLKFVQDFLKEDNK